MQFWPRVVAASWGKGAVPQGGHAYAAWMLALLWQGAAWAVVEDRLPE